MLTFFERFKQFEQFKLFLFFAKTKKLLEFLMKKGYNKDKIVSDPILELIFLPAKVNPS